MDMYTRKQTHPSESNRIDREEVTRLYKQKEIFKISLNDQLDSFYEKCRTNQFPGHEVAFFFHAELLTSNEFKQYHKRYCEIQKKRFPNKIRALEKQFQKLDVKQLEKKITRSKREHENNLKASKNKAYRLFGGIRATLLFHPKRGLPSDESLNRLFDNLKPMLFTQLWRKWDPLKIPKSTSNINVIGFQEYEDNEQITQHNCSALCLFSGYDSAFPPLALEKCPTLSG